MKRLIRSIYKDYRRWRAIGDRPLAVLLTTQGFWAICVYRTSHAALLAVKDTLFHRPVSYLLWFAHKLIEIVTGIHIPPDSAIGDGLYIVHFGNIFLPPVSRGSIGRNCTISQGVTIGVGGHGASRGVPVIGNRVYIAANAVVVGKITVGDDAYICAGAVVLRSVPARAVVLGNPARVISFDGSFADIIYDGMDADPDRIQALAERERSSNAVRRAHDGHVPHGANPGGVLLLPPISAD